MRVSTITTDTQAEQTLPFVLVLGDTDRGEMRPLMTWLEERVLSAARYRVARDVTTANALFAAGEFPDLIVVLQSWPNEYSTQDVNRLLSFAPLARVIVCYGAWCESDGRNHNVWPLSVRVPVWAAPPRIEREWTLLLTPGEITPLPWSASREEVFAADHPSSSIFTGRQSVVIDSPDAAYRQFLSEISVAEGSVVSLDEPTVVLFDADPWSPSRSAVMQELRVRYPRADLIALVSLADPTMLAELHQLGADNVLHKLGFRPWMCGRSL